MRGGLDDALDKLARREEVRRRAAGEATGTSPAVAELVEAIAGVVARHPELGVTVGAEGSGEPLLLHFYFSDGQVQVTADPAVPRPVSTPTARHADFDIELDEPVEVPYSPAPASPAPEQRRSSHDDQDRYGYRHEESYFPEPDTAERRYGSFDSPPAAEHRHAHPGEDSRDLGARMRDLGMASRGAAPTSPPVYPPHPFAATPPPPVPPQTTSRPPQDPADAQTTRRIQTEHHRAPAEAAATERIQPQRGGMPTPLPKPIPLQVERPEETEMAARRLAALLRDDPSLLHQAPRD